MTDKQSLGPWHLGIDGHVYDGLTGREKIADVEHGRGEESVKGRTGRLIAAAPDLLAACEMSLSLLQNIGTGKWANTPAGDALRDAIKKATGETHEPFTG